MAEVFKPQEPITWTPAESLYNENDNAKTLDEKIEQLENNFADLVGKQLEREEKDLPTGKVDEEIEKNTQQIIELENQIKK